MRKTHKKLLTFISALTLFSTAVVSYAQSNTDLDLTALSKALNGKKMQVVEESPIKGIYLVNVENTPIYLSQDGRYAFQGSLVDLDSRVDLSEAFSQKVRAEALKNIKSEDLIIYPAKDAKHSIYIFTDIDCSYCRKLHAELQSYLDVGITIKYLAFPRSGSKGESAKKAIQVWCSADRNKALTEAKSQGSFSQGELCENNPVKAQYDLGVSLGINGTPAIILENGILVPGYMEADKLLETLNAHAVK